LEISKILKLKIKNYIKYGWNWMDIGSYAISVLAALFQFTLIFF